MRATRTVWTEKDGWSAGVAETSAGDAPELVLVFGATAPLTGPLFGEIRARFPTAYICGCSTAGEIAGARVLDDSVVVTAIKLQGTTFRAADVSISSPGDSFSAGRELAARLPHEGLVHAFVLSDGLVVNGSELVRGLGQGLPPGVAATGGLSGDGARFAATYVCANDAPAQKRVMALGFYGNRLRVGYGSMGGWAAFGPERRITRSHGNVLLELDGRSALDLYKEYLGHHAEGLPASALLFPLALRASESEESVVRTVLAVSEQDKSMTFAGDMPQGGLARLMRSNLERIVDGASGAARACQKLPDGRRPELAVLISCVGRKLLLKQRIEEEIDGVVEVLGPGTSTTGFYSYGEISPLSPEVRCTLHNQTMTITTFAEV